VGQSLPYATPPQITVTARNGTANGLTNAITRNYAGAYMKLSNAIGTSLNQAPYDSQDGRYARFDVLGGALTPGLNTLALPATSADPVIGAFTEGVGTLTFASGLAMLRSTTVPSAPFDADIALSLNIVDTDGVAYAANPARFGDTSAGNGMAFSSGKLMRFGRLRVDNAVGSDKLDLQMGLRIEYWTGSAFAVNSLDSCTTLIAKNFSLANHQPGLVGAGAGANMLSPTAGSDGNVAMGGAFVAGIASVTILKPNPAATAPGSVDVCLDLDVSPGTGDATCQAAVPADKRWLQMLRTNPPGTHTQDPVGRAAFGLYGSQPKNFIYFRENF
ncbi:MAG TPA: DUF6701 domain-containing protein, partial [Burkholderiales bacterium]|nr:DUF6701 domain-containing protein [Burkholderiales bacterium]